MTKTLKNYGVPYMGSKSKILKDICTLFPKAENFYDLFGGGFSVSHFMLVHRKNDYKHFHYNEIRVGVPQLIQDAVRGKYSYENFKPEFIGRDEFFKRINEPYVKMVWSFGNNGKDYLFSKEIEPYKKSMHNAIIFNEFDMLAKKTLGMDQFKGGYSVKDRRFFLRSRVETFRRDGIPDFLKDYINDRQLQRLEQLERLKQLQQIERLHYYNASYDQIEIKNNSVIYCDPPYANTRGYDKRFDHKKFFDWADSQICPVFISEYDIPDKRFTLIKRIKKRSMLGNNRDSALMKDERVYLNRAGLKLL